MWLKCPGLNYFIEPDDYLDINTLKFQLVRELSLLSVVMNQQEVSEDEEDLEEEG